MAATDDGAGLMRLQRRGKLSQVKLISSNQSGSFEGVDYAGDSTLLLISLGAVYKNET